MSEFLIPDERPPAPRRTHAAVALASSARPFPSATVRVAPVSGGVRLTFVPTAGPAQGQALVAALAAVVDRERGAGSFVHLAVDGPHADGTIALTITGPPALDLGRRA
ncbi:MAG TPA: hypothetical protein VGD56_10460 [Gemmatirosa sp.]